jgi:hypothetical protein
MVGVETSAHYLHKQLNKNLYPEFLLHFQKQQQKQTMMLNMSFHFILALCKQAPKPKAQRGQHRVVVGASCTQNISLSKPSLL